jgi:hypothetical protein
MNPGFAGRPNAVEAALLEYQRAPGQYPLLLRRPEILFRSVKDILLLAGGRVPGGIAPAAPAVQRAAGFFIRSALLYPAADHYALLGLDRSADAAAIKDRYRQMMRLMHPDFASAAAGGNWPTDAASRINQAYEVLASPARRRGYDEKLGSAPPVRGPAVPVPAKRSNVASGSASIRDSRRLLKRMAGAFGILAALALVGSLLARGPDKESLVQREPPRVAAAASTTAETADNAALLASFAQPAPASDPAWLRPPATPAIVQEPPAPSRATPLSEAVRAATLDAMPPSAVAAASSAARMLPVSVDAPGLFPPAGPAPAAVTALAQAAPLAPPSPAATPKASAPPAVSLAEAHTLLSGLLQEMESGSGERLLSGLDGATRNAPAAQALVRQYNILVGSSRSVKVSHVQLRAEPRDDRLLIKGQVQLEIVESRNMRSRELPLEAEFGKRNGDVVMTRLAPGQGTAGAGP